MCRRTRSRTESFPVWTGFPPLSLRQAIPTSARNCSRENTYNVHLEGYNPMYAITGKGPSARHEIFYFTESTLAAVRINDFKYRFTDQPGGWLGATVKVDWPILTNLRLDPFERLGMFNG